MAKAAAALKVVEVPAIGHNSDGELTEAERKALLLDGLSKLEGLIETKDEAVSAVRTQRKKLVAHGFAPKVIDFALRLRKDDDDEMIEQRRAEIEVARFLNHPIGTQPELPLNMEDRTPDVERARAAGEIAGAEGKSRVPPYATGSAQEQEWLEGWSVGQSTLLSAFKKLEAKAPPAEEGDESDED